jgi:hypothetical protein
MKFSDNLDWVAATGLALIFSLAAAAGLSENRSLECHVSTVINGKTVDCPRIVNQGDKQVFQCPTVLPPAAP